MFRYLCNVTREIDGVADEYNVPTTTASTVYTGLRCSFPERATDHQRLVEFEANVQLYGVRTPLGTVLKKRDELVDIRTRDGSVKVPRMEVMYTQPQRTHLAVFARHVELADE